MSKNNKVCPHCGSRMFIATVTKGCVVEIHAEEGMDDEFHVLKESSNNPTYEIVACAKCKKELTQNDLLAGVICKECGKVVSPAEVNEEGLCAVCVAVKERTDLQNASKEDLIRMLIQAEKNSNPVAQKIEKTVAKADDVVADIAPAPAQIVTETERETVEEQPSEEKPKRRSRRKKDDTTEEVITEAVETEEIEETSATEAVTEDVSNIADQQEAPFPNIEPDQTFDAMPAPVPPTENTQGFEMFPDDDEQF